MACELPDLYVVVEGCPFLLGRFEVALDCELILELLLDRASQPRPVQTCTADPGREVTKYDKMHIMLFVVGMLTLARVLL